MRMVDYEIAQKMMTEIDTLSRACRAPSYTLYMETTEGMRSIPVSPNLKLVIKDQLTKEKNTVIAAFDKL